MHCRIGSSEIKEYGWDETMQMHCRIGSSENNDKRPSEWEIYALPYRQLRK